jgi:hypothetical protein
MRTRVNIPVALLIIALASYVVFLEVEASDESDEQVSASAVWAPEDAQLQEINQACRAASQNYSQCFVEEMTRAGASSEAVAFTQSFSQQKGMIAFLKDFRPVDAVDVGYAFFPTGADFNQRWLLLNGIPAVIDVDDLNLLPQAEMKRDPAYLALQKSHPKLTLFDGDRGVGSAPASETLADAGQRFLVDYPLKDQCRACAVMGTASFSFEFDPMGRLLGVKFVRITAATPQQ